MALKKGLSLLLIPSGVVLACLFLGFLLWPLSRCRRMTRNLFFLAFLVYALAGSGLMANLLLWGLEPSPDAENLHLVQSEDVSTLVVLCGGVSYEGGPSLEDRLTPSTVLRLLKAWKVIRANPRLREVIVIGGCGRVAGCPEPEARLAGRWLVELGLPTGVQVVLEERSRDTEENFINLIPFVGDRPFFLVTSAAHMPRALLLAKYLKLKALPLPCHFLAHTPSWTFDDFWASPRNLAKSDFAVHEYLGLAWAWARHHLPAMRDAG